MSEAKRKIICRSCGGCGEVAAMSDSSPYAYDVMIACPSCQGTGVIFALTPGAFEAERAHLAGLAMQGLLARANANTNEQTVARNAVIYADALIAELQKEKDHE